MNRFCEMIQHLEPRRLLAAQAYDWNSVTIKGNGYIDGIVYSQAAADVAYIHTDMGGAYRLDPTTNRWSPLTDWIPINDQIQNNGAQSMAVDPTDPNRVYLVAGTYQSNAAFLRSSDQGRTWQRTDVSGIKVDANGWGRNVGERLAVDPNQPSTLYYGAQYYSASASGLWKSSDSGATWNKVSFPALGDIWNSSYSNANGVGLGFVLFDKTSASAGSATQTMYVGVSTVASSSSKIYRTTNGGSAWAAIPNQPTTTLTPNRAVLTPDGNTMYVAYSKESGPYATTATAGAVYKVTNPSSASPTWTLVTPSAGAYSAVAIDPTTPTTVYAAVFDRYPDNIYRSTNGGTSWTALNPVSHLDNSSAAFAASQSTHWLTDLEIDPFNRNVAMFNTGYGIFRTTNLTAAAPTWSFYNDGFEQSVPLELASPSTGSVHLLSAVGDRGGFRHVDFATSPVIGSNGQNNGLNVGTDNDIDVAWNDPNYVVRVVQTSPYVQYSVNNGVNWSWFSATNTSGDGGGNGNISISADGTRAAFEPSGSGQVRYATRTGSTWSAWTNPTTNTPADGAKLVADLVSPTTFYAYVGTTVSRSTDGGANWTVMTSTAPSNGGWIRAVAGNSGHLLISRGGSGLWRSIDGGATWAQLSSGVVTTANQVGTGAAATPGGYPAIFIGGTVSGQNGFFRSDDQGATWTLISDLSHNYGAVVVIQGDPQVYGRLYVGTNGRGILYADIHSALPPIAAGWNTQDIGSPASAGGAGQAAGTYELIGGGAGVTGASDQFRYAYQQLTGDGSITARVMGVPLGSPGNYGAKAGVMFRNSLAPSSSNAFAAVTPGAVGGVVFQDRVSTSTTTIASATAGVWPPYWVRLIRTGNQFTALVSPDGTTWTQLGLPQAIAMNQTIYVGLAVSAGNNSQVDISQFQNVRITTAPVATISQVSPDPTSTSVSSLTITFDQPVTGFDLSDLSFERDGQSINLAGASLSSGDGGTTWVLSGISALTSNVGGYMLSLVGSGSAIVNGAGVPLTANEAEAWVMNSLNATSASDQINLVRNGVRTEYRLGGVLQYSFNAALLPTLVVQSVGGDAFTLDYSAGDPTPTGATFIGGPNQDSLAIVGSTSGDTVSFTASSVSLGATLNFSGVERLSFDGNGGADDLTIGGTTVVSASATQVLNSLSIGADAALDVGANALIVMHGDTGTWGGSSYSGLSALITQGRSGGAWNGNGIISTAAAASAGLTSVGIGRAADVLGLGSADTAVWRGQTVSSDSVLIRYTYTGDATLDGKINVDDYTRIDFSAPLSVSGWFNGDFNYDGKINVDDYTIIDFNVHIQGDPL